MSQILKKENIYGEDPLNEVRLARIIGNGIDKMLILETNISNLMSHFIVRSNNENLYYGSDIDKAIDTYNKA